MKIYGSKWPWTRDCRARWLLEEIGEPYEYIELDILNKEHQSEAHFRRHPLGLIPVLEDGDVRIFESAAILTYLAETYAPDFIPPVGTKSRALYHQWVFFAMAHLEAPAVAVARARIFPNLEGQREEAERLRPKFAQILPALEAQLASGPYLAGNIFTAADILVGCMLYLAEKGRATQAFPHITAYIARLKARPAFQRALAPATVRRKMAEAIPA